MMSYSTAVSFYSKPKAGILSRLKRLLTSPLAISALLAYLLVLTAVIFSLAQPKSYRSQFSLMLPGNGSNSNVVIDKIGQVSTSSPSAFGDSHNPRSNYKAILMSDNLREVVKDKLLHIGSVSKPKITLLEQTSIINLDTKSGSAVKAREISWAYYKAFQEELDRLRADESKRRADGIERVLDGYRERLTGTRSAIVNFKQRSLLISQSQLDHAVSMIAKVRDQLTFTRAEASSQKMYMQQLSGNLGVSSDLAAQALRLQSDSQFNGYLSEMGSAATQLSKYQSQWGSKHPKVVVERERFKIVLAHLRQRSTELVGLNSSELLHSMNLTASVNLSNLFAELLASAAKLEGFQAKIRDLSLADIRLEQQLRVYSRESAELERLEREHQRAEAVYSSAAARLEAGQADIFASFPVVQLIAAPSLANRHDNLGELTALAVGFAGFIMITLLVFIVWQRQFLLTVLLKKG
jgi:uncharacterized protein involved in exopolysaccharide biosynthesis